MGYGFDEKTKSEEGGNSKFLRPGIQEGVYLDKIEYGELPSNKAAYFSISIKDASGKKAERKYFEPTLNQWVQTQADLEVKQANFSAIVKNLATKFLGENYTMPKESSFKKFCEAIIKNIGEKHVGVELRAKIVLNKGNYPSLPDYAPVFELASLKESKLFIGKKERIEAVEADIDTPAPTFTKTNDVDSLPF